MRVKFSNCLFLVVIATALLARNNDKKEIASLSENVDNLSHVNRVLQLDKDVMTTVNDSLVREVRRLEECNVKLLQQLEMQEEEKRQKKEEVASPFSTAELDLLYRLVEAEAGAESEAGKIAVANVVFNRMRSAKFPNTLTEVINQPYQFEPVTTRKIDEVEVSDETIIAVDKAVAGAKIVSDDIVFFWAKWLNENHEIWDACEISTTIGVHHFSDEWKS